MPIEAADYGAVSLCNRTMRVVLVSSRSTRSLRERELRLLARAWHVARELNGCTPSTAHIDELLDERSATMTVAGV